MTTNYNDITTVAAFLSPKVAEHMESAFVMKGLVTTEPFTIGSSSKKFSRDGSHVATVTAEGAAAALSTYTETNMTLTGQKATVYQKRSWEAIKWAGANAQKMARAAGTALARKVDKDILALASSFSGSVGTTGTATTIAHISEAAYELELADYVDDLALVLHVGQGHDLRNEILDSEKSFQTNNNGDLASANRPKGLKGSILDIPVYVTNQVSVASNDASGLLMSRDAIALLINDTVEVNGDWIVQNSVAEFNSITPYQTGIWVDAAAIEILGRDGQ